ncbi:2-succinyl-5-enolpyruvyl-6-hydroxy-3-cyclohexene-1-carboxylic-acid synthase [Lunatibacter salilacus]|uniref:2-succinyl-5-enolpyruvyl-6-hydroxy-3- cyclohexene-1-carboxylic-acid synthase n=1 Tax=Lunatibacter salilacus TaxID=2483804 RepID=UPI00131C8019|nr:2-succinyl-5-enolpyruvyl-6-hydroxy-3-cyclohexene-1-carboxylic-acid synthase [Lunatibacter salilacus]
MIIQPIIDLATICAAKGIKEAILSPGSRCAPLSLAFIRHPDIHCRTIPDERSAAFIGLGMAQQLNKPVVLVCTSGSAALNYFPAVAEAYFQQIPLLILTADRPAEWIDQLDGQTIRQTDVYGSHVKKSYAFPDSFEHSDKRWHAHRIINEAINESMSTPKGPVHVNIPLREPFYPTGEEGFDFEQPVQLIDVTSGVLTLSEDQKSSLKTQLGKYRKILVIPGQQKPRAEVRKLLSQVAQQKKATVISDLITNTHTSESVNHPDFILQTIPEKSAMIPDLVISFGKSILSKSLKQFLRSSSATHWHLQESGYVPDPYQKLSKIIHCQPIEILELMLDLQAEGDPNFIQAWKDSEGVIGENLQGIFEDAAFGEFKALACCFREIPHASKLHLSNSMTVRYASFLGNLHPSIEIIANRGTSGIDGSNSTAVGCTFTTKDVVTLVTGDMAFFYDRNAFWHKYNLPNLRIIVLNNHAGGIFRLIEGPAQLPELEEFFETEQKLSASHLAVEFGFGYTPIYTAEELDTALVYFYGKSIRPKVLEIFSESKLNAEILKSVKRKLKISIP